MLGQVHFPASTRLYDDIGGGGVREGLSSFRSTTVAETTALPVRLFFHLFCLDLHLTSLVAFFVTCIFIYFISFSEQGVYIDVLTRYSPRVGKSEHRL